MRTNIFRNSFAVLLLPLAVLLLASACKPEAEETDDGNGGIGACTWTITGTAGNYTLTISGAGAMGGYAFYSNVPWYSYHEGIKNLVIQDGVTTIGMYAFYGCSKLTSVTNHSTTPQSISSDVFSGVSLSNCTLRVPSSSVNAYKAANYWKNFGDITGI
jgi:hypothetical protein